MSSFFHSRPYHNTSSHKEIIETHRHVPATHCPAVLCNVSHLPQSSKIDADLKEKLGADAQQCKSFRFPAGGTGRLTDNKAGISLLMFPCRCFDQGRRAQDYTVNNIWVAAHVVLVLRFRPSATSLETKRLIHRARRHATSEANSSAQEELLIFCSTYVKS